MKKLILLITNLAFGFLQNLYCNENSSLLKFDTIIQLDTSLKKDVIYNSVEYWLTAIYNNSSKVIDLKSQNNGIIVFEGSIPYNVQKFKDICYEGNLLFNSTIRIKDSKINISMDNMRHEHKSNTTCIYFKGFGLLNSSYLNKQKYGMGTTENGNISNYNNCIYELKVFFNNMVASLVDSIENDKKNKW